MKGFGGVLLVFMLCALPASAGEPKTVTPEMAGAIQQGNVPAFTAAVSSADLANAVVQPGVTLLLALTDAGLTDFVRVLLDKGADANTRGPKGVTPLILALEQGRTDVAKLLLEKGASTDLRDSRGQAALCVATAKRDADLVTALLEHKAAVDVRCTEERTPFLIAVYGKNNAVAELLLAGGADVKARDLSGYSALHLAAKNMDLEWIQRLVGLGLDVNVPDLDDATPLDVLVGPPTPEENPARAWLLGKGAKPGAEGSAFRRAYHGILIDEEYSKVRALIRDKDYDVNRHLADGQTLLHLAWSHANSGAAEALVERGATPGMLTRDGRNGLHVLAARREHKGNIASLVSKLVTQYKLDLNLKDDAGATPVITAARACNPQVLESLLHFRADVRATDLDGEAAIHHAARCTDFTGNLLESLKAADADLNARDGRGRTPLDVARDAGNQRAFEILQGWGARSGQEQ